MNNKLFVSCVESRIEQETNWYSRFEIGPFGSGQGLTVANSLRRTLLATQTGIFLTAVEIDGAIHEYSRLEGIKESVLDILLNLRQISLFSSEEFENQETLVGYFDLQGPLEVKAKHLKLPKGIECCNPNQHIATLTRNCNFQGRFLITINSTLLFKSHSIGDPVNFKNIMAKSPFSERFTEKNWMYVNPITNSIRRVNYAVEQFGDVWEQKEVVVLELWTNGTIHPKQAIQNACTSLSAVFSSISSFNTAFLSFPSAMSKFKKLKTEILEEQVLSGFLESPQTSKTLLPLKDEKPTILLDLDITNLNVSFKTFLALKTEKIDNIGNLLQCEKESLIAKAKLSNDQVQELDEALAIFGLAF